MAEFDLEAIRARDAMFAHVPVERLVTQSMVDRRALLAAYDALAAENAALRSTIDDLTAGEIHTCHDHCQRTACILRRENTALRSRLADIESQNRVMWDVASDREARLAEVEEELAQWQATGESVTRNEHDIAARLAEAERDMDQLLKERDYAEGMADKLADALATMLCVDIGEHSSGNCPWTEALEAFEERATDSATHRENDSHD